MTATGEPAMGIVSMIGIALAEPAIRLHRSAADGAAPFRRRLRRAKPPAFLAAPPAGMVAMAACASARCRGRGTGRLGQAARLVAPACVEPLAERRKNDRAEAEAIGEAAGRPSMRFVAVESVTRQASAQSS